MTGDPVEVAAGPVRGRRPGKIARTSCPECGQDAARRQSGQPFRHRVVAANGYTRLGFCRGGEHGYRMPEPANHESETQT